MSKTDRILSPQQELFLASYTNPKSETFGNALQSALKAGYKQEYAENITNLMPDWLSESMGDMIMLRKAERVLNKTLEDDFDYEEVIINGQAVGAKKREPALTRIKQDSAKFIAERLNKKKYSTQRNTDITTDGKPISVLIAPELAEKNDIAQSPENNSEGQA